jgi:hypothetical protein
MLKLALTPRSNICLAYARRAEHNAVAEQQWWAVTCYCRLAAARTAISHKPTFIAIHFVNTCWHRRIEPG